VLYCLQEEKYYLIDFGDWRWEWAEFDIIHFLLFWAAAFKKERFLLVISSFLNGYNKRRTISVEKWQEMYPQAESYFDQRRQQFNKQELNSSRDEKINREKIFTADFGV
jgi:Ser/Thr protein kinase RdoA (MazF antagonist)